MNELDKLFFLYIHDYSCIYVLYILSEIENINYHLY